MGYYDFSAPQDDNPYFELKVERVPMEVYDSHTNNFAGYLYATLTITACEHFVHFSCKIYGNEKVGLLYDIRYKVSLDYLDESYEDLTKGFAERLKSENLFSHSEIKYEITLDLKRDHVTEWLCEKFEVTNNEQTEIYYIHFGKLRTHHNRRQVCCQLLG